MDSNTKINEEGNENKLEESNIKNEQQANTVPNEITKNILEEKEKDKNLSQLNENTNSITNNEKEKRTRRGKSETTERIFKCPDCEKSYLSGPALIIHRKLSINIINQMKIMLAGGQKRSPKMKIIT